MMGNTKEMNNNNVEDKSSTIEVRETEAEEARIDHFIARFDKLLKIYEERMAEDMKLEIWNAHVRNEIMGIQMKDGDIFVGKSRFSYGENYTSVDQLTEMIDFNFKMANGVPIGYHIGGRSVNLFISNIKQIFVMTETEVADANQYANMAPEFIKRLLPGY
jgi:hypothetical protein